MDPKERILEASAKLFSEKGFSAVGVREIASEAKVNVSMISYYFNGKNGILIELMKNYFEKLEDMVINIKNKSSSQEDNLKLLIITIVDYLRKNHCSFKAIYNEMPLDIPEIYDYKLKMLSNLINTIKSNFSSAKANETQTVYDLIVGNAFMSLIFSNFLFGEKMKKIYNIEYDDAFYDKYASIISALFISGIKGVSEYIKNNTKN